MPNRILRDSIRTSESLALLSAAEERHFYRLLTVADDYGRFDARASVIRGACYSLHGNAISMNDVAKWTKRLAAPEIRIITLYTINGRNYGVFVNWRKYQGPARAKESRYPAAPVDDEHMPNTCEHVSNTCKHMSASAPVIGIGIGIENGIEIGIHEDVVPAAMKNPSPPPPPVPAHFLKLTELPGYRVGNHTRAFRNIEAGCAAAKVEVAEVVAVYADYYRAHQIRLAWKEPVRPLVRNLHREIAKVLRGEKGGVNAKFRPNTPGIYEQAAAAQRERQRGKSSTSSST